MKDSTRQYIDDLERERNALKIRVKDLTEGIAGYEDNNNKYHELCRMLLSQDEINILKLKQIIFSI